MSCSDIEKEIASLDTQATENAAAIADLNSKIAALQTALNAAQADADAAQKAADAAAAAAATAKADAIAAAKAEVEAAKAAIEAGVATDLAAVNAKVASVEAALALKADKATVDLLAATLENYKATLSAEDTELWTSVSELLEALTNLQGRLDATEMSVEDLTVAVNEAVESVKAINTSLASVYDILGALANQIQSVVFVPEYANASEPVRALGLAYETKNGTNYTNLVAKMTYEVRPAKLAASITSENVSFSSVNVKAAAPQYFKGEVLSADPATGRVEVAVIFNDVKGDKDDYTALFNGETVAVSLNIASVDVTELLIADAQPENVDMVSSNYANVTCNGFWALQSAYRFFDGKSYFRNWSKSYAIPYNYIGTPAGSKALFPDFEIVVGCWNEEDEAYAYYTPEVASKLFGLDLTVTYTGKDAEGKDVKPVYSAVDTNEDEKIESPVVVTGNGLDAVATLVESADYKGKNAIDQYARLTLGQFKAAGLVLNLSAKATCYVDPGKVDAEVVVAPITKAWSYTDKTVAWSATEFAEVELTVNTDVVDDIVKLFGGHSNGTWLYYDEFDEDGNYTGNYAGIHVYAASKNVVVANAITYNSPVLKYGTEQKTYTFTNTRRNSEKVDYTIALDVVLAPMPEAKTIDLGTFTVIGDVVKSQDVAVSPVAKAVEAIKAFDKNVALDKVEWNYVGKKDVDGVTLNGEAEDAASLVLAVGPNAKDPKVIEDQSYVTVNKVAKYENTIVVTQTYEICGVEYTFVATVKTEAPSLSISANEVYVANGVATVDGTVNLPISKTTTSVETGKSTSYVLNAINLRNYVKTQLPAELNTDGYQLRYTLVTPMTEKDKDGNDKLIYGTTPSVVVDYADVDAAMPLTWAVDHNELEYEIAIVTPATEDVNGDDKKDSKDDIVFGAVNVKLQIPSLVTYTAANTVTAKVVNGENTTANIVGAFTVVDKFGNNVYNPYAQDMSDIFDGYKATLDKNGKVTSVASYNDNFFNVYSMTYKLAEPKDVKVYLNNTEIAQSQVIYTYDDKTGSIVLSKENANLTGDVKFEVPVTFNNIYGTEQKVTAVVVFSMNATETEGPAVGSLPTPDAAQWEYTVDGYKFVVDLGYTKENVLIQGQNEPIYNEDWTEVIGSEWSYYTTSMISNYSVNPTTATSGSITWTQTQTDWMGETTSSNYIIYYSELTETSVNLLSYMHNDGSELCGIQIAAYDENDYGLTNPKPVKATATKHTLTEKESGIGGW